MAGEVEAFREELEKLRVENLQLRQQLQAKDKTIQNLGEKIAALADRVHKWYVRGGPAMESICRELRQHVTEAGAKLPPK